MKVTCAWCGAEIRSLPEESDSPERRDSHGICEPCSRTLIENLGIPLGRFLSNLNAPVLLVDRDVRVLEASPGALDALDAPAENVLGRLGGEVFECANASLPGGCGRSVHCSGCVLRNTVTSTWETGVSHIGIPATLHVTRDTAPDRVDLIVSTARVGDRVVLKIDSPD